MKLGFLFLSFILLTGLSTNVALAETKIQKYNEMYVSSNSGSLFLYNFKSKKTEEIAQLPLSINDIAACPRRKIYLNVDGNSLYKFDETTKKSKIVGYFDYSNINNFTCTSKGIIYGVSSHGDLYRISTATGKAKFIKYLGDILIGGGVITAQGVDTLYFVSHLGSDILYKMNTKSGEITQTSVRGSFLIQSNGMSYLKGKVYQIGSTSVYTIDVQSGSSRSWGTFNSVLRKASGLAIIQ